MRAGEIIATLRRQKRTMRVEDDVLWIKPRPSGELGKAISENKADIIALLRDEPSAFEAAELLVYAITVIPAAPDPLSDADRKVIEWNNAAYARRYKWVSVKWGHKMVVDTSAEAAS